MPAPRLPGMDFTPSPRSCRCFFVAPPSRIALSACKMPTGATLGQCKPPARRLHIRMTPSLSALHVPPPPPSAVVLLPDFLPRRLRRVSVVITSSPSRLFRHQGLPVSDHRVHNHIENGGRQWVSLSNESLYAEGLSVLPSCPHHQLQPLPIPAEEAEGPAPHAISLQDIQLPGPVQGIV